jgi:predicted nucleotidyltransferase
MADRQPDLPLPVEEIAELCRRHRVAELAAFGSILRSDFGPESDVDFLVRFVDDDLGPWMSRLDELRRDLERLLGRRVDVVDWEGVERSPNPYRRAGILAAHRLLYAA